ncbi:MAG: LysM peptidoglycan-binding domain-containing protein [Pseudonocardiaceae bacterium]
MPSGVRPVRRLAALTPELPAPPVPVPPVAPTVRSRQPGCVAHRRMLVPAQGGMAAASLPALRSGRLSRVVAAATVTVAVVGGLGWIGQGAGPGIPGQTAVVRVGGGETLWDVARRVAPQSDQSAVVHRIRELNGMVGSAIEPGQRLQVPDGR